MRHLNIGLAILVFLLSLSITSLALSINKVRLQASDYKASIKTENPPVEKVVFKPQAKTLEIGGQILSVEIADTATLRSKGLSNRPSLQTGTGMIFIFDKPDIYGFWMKDMNFPIDILWIDADWKIVSIEKNVSPDTYPKTFTPSKPIKYVLETNAGELK